MLFSNIVYAALAQSLTASAATMMVTVAANNQFTFTPNTITAQPGDMVAFNFVAQVRHSYPTPYYSPQLTSHQNHSVASSNANSPCQPQRNAIFSNFQPIPGNPNGSPGASGGNGRNANRQAGTSPMFMVPITDTAPMYIYCSQAQHCQQGMVMVINPPNAQAVTQYANKAAQANNNVSPRGGVSGGQVLNNKAGTNPKNVLGAQAGDAATTANTKGNGKGKGGGGLAGLFGLGKNNRK
jgi:hypothetical protein